MAHLLNFMFAFFGKNFKYIIMKYIFTVLVAAITLSAAAQDRSIQFRDLTWKEAQKASKKEKKPIFMDAYAVWCGPCKWMSANMFTHNEIADFYNENYICVKFDMEKGEGKDLAKKYNVRGYPTLIYTDHKGELLYITVGASQNPTDYVKMGQRAMDSKANMPYYRKNYTKNKEDAKFMREYFSLMNSANLLNDDELNEYFASVTDNDLTSANNWKIILNNVDKSNIPVFKRVLKNYDAFEAIYADTIELYVNYVYSGELRSAFYKAKTDEEITRYNELKSEILNSDFKGRKRLEYDINSYEYRARKEWDNYFNYQMDNLQEFGWNNANSLNSIAWDCYEISENISHLEAALVWTERAIDLDSESPHIWDTYAHLFYKLHDYEKAIETEKIALDMAKEQGLDVKDYESAIKKFKDSIE